MSDATPGVLAHSSDESSVPLSFSLEVRGGLTGFRRRPILGDRFLIGSDPVCDLRLDGRLAAPLHCVLRRDGARLEAERLSDLPMAVNGTPVDHDELESGDTLGVGPVRLIVHALQVAFDVVRPGDLLDESLAGMKSSRPAAKVLEERSALQLVELIDAEHRRIRELEDRRKAGATALLDAVRRQQRPAPEAVAEQATLGSLVTRLDRLSATLERQAKRSLTGESEIREAAAELLAAQQELLGQADRLWRMASSLADAGRVARRNAA